MTDLMDAIPPHEPAEDALALAGKLALSAVPVIGGMAAETLAHALETRQAQRQHDFNVTMARSLQSALDRFRTTVTLEEIVHSDEFLAAFTRAQRAAAETTSETKRRRLAASVMNAGSWAPFSTTERDQFARLVDDFSELHVWLLHYFTDPKAWLQARGLDEQHTHVILGSIEGPLGSALGSSSRTWLSEVTQAAADLDREGLAYIPLKTNMSGQGTIEPRTKEKGRRFLAYLAEGPSVNAEPPTL